MNSLPSSFNEETLEFDQNMISYGPSADVNYDNGITKLISSSDDRIFGFEAFPITVNTANIIEFNLIVFCFTSGLNPDTKIEFKLIQTSTGSIQSVFLDFENLETFQTYKTNFRFRFSVVPDTQYSYEIVVHNGWQNIIGIDYLKYSLVNQNSTHRTYFVLDDFYSELLSNDVQHNHFCLLKHEINGVDILNDTWVNEIKSNILEQTPYNDFFLANADLDGNNRDETITPYNTWNPFKKAFKISGFDTNNYFSGSGENDESTSGTMPAIVKKYGTDLPEIINLLNQNNLAPIYIDLDYQDSFKIEFEAVASVNQTDLSSGNLRANPSFHRIYTIIWDAKNCDKQFFYTDLIRNNTVDQLHNGFLFGQTPIITDESIKSGKTLIGQNKNSYNEYKLDFGLDKGIVGIEYNAFNSPKRFILKWNGQTFQTPFVGSNRYDNQLKDFGYSGPEIGTSNPSNGFGILEFNKTDRNISEATLIIESPFDDPTWTAKIIGVDNSVKTFVSLSKIGEKTNPFQEVYFEVYNPYKDKPKPGQSVYLDNDRTSLFDGQDKTYIIKTIMAKKSVYSDYLIEIDPIGIIRTVNELNENKPVFKEIFSSSNSTTQLQKQKFEINENIEPGTIYSLIAYGVSVDYTVLPGDTNINIAKNLTKYLNALTDTNWNSEGQAPPGSTPGFPPTATSNDNIIETIINLGDKFTSKIS